jgi:hypothetical protein
MKHLLLFENFNTTSHLKGRGIDTEKTRVIIDEESGDTFFFLYNLTGQMVGYQKYNPKFPKKGQNSKNLGNPKDTKYYNWVGEEDEGKKIAVWGLESYNVSDKYMFITEGIFDIARAHEAGYPGIAVLGNDPTPQLKFWLKTLPQIKVVIYDNDVAGKKLRKLGDYSFSVETGKDLNDLTPEQAKIFLEGVIDKIEKVNESNAYSLEEYNSYITSELGKYDLRPAQINQLLDFYSNEIEDSFNNGQFPKIFVDKIVGELELNTGGFPTIKIPNASIKQLKYL